MPELPEVETIVRALTPALKGKKIMGVWSDEPRLFRGGVSYTEIKRTATGRKITSLERKGKNIIFHLSGGDDLIIHLMMSGSLLLGHHPAHDRHVHFRLGLTGKTELSFNDPRKFGTVKLARAEKDTRHILHTLGPDALLISEKELKDVLGGKKGKIKSVLLNQTVVSGIGNIYSDEILWEAGIHPERKANTLSGGEMKKLHRAIRRILHLAIKKQGTSSRDYRKPDASEGGYYNIRKAYQRTDEPCVRDGALIKRKTINGRTAHFCPQHQK